MALPSQAGCDVRDLYVIHRVLRTLFGRAPALIASCGADPDRHALLDAHIEEITEVLHRHHHGEDITLWDRLAERRPACALHVGMMRAQHAEIAVHLERVADAHARWKADRAGAQSELTDALAAVDESLAAHLAQEEPFVTGNAPELLAQKEWDEMRDHGIAGIPKDRMLVQLGYMLRSFDSEEERTEFWRALPAIARVMYRLFGARSLSKELAAPVRRRCVARGPPRRGSIPNMDEYEGGDSACWLANVCPECGALLDDLSAPCWRCGLKPGEERPAASTPQ